NQFPAAKALFTAALQLDKGRSDAGAPPYDPYLIQRHVLATYKAEQPNRVAALNEARARLETLSPRESNDSGTLELLGDIELALFDAGQGFNHLVSARRAYERLYTIKRDWHSGVTFAYLIALHAGYQKEPEEQFADMIYAKRLRREVIELGQKRLAEINFLRRNEDRLPEAL